MQPEYKQSGVIIMKTGIIGAGAMGSILSYFFVKENIETVLYEKDKDTIDHIKNGLNTIVEEEKHITKIDISGNPDILKECGIIFIFTKSYTTEAAVKEIKKVINEKSIFVTLQNGIGNKEIIAQHIPEERIVYGSTSLGATKVDAGTVRLGGMGSFTIGSVNNQALKRVEDLLKKAKFEVIVTDVPDTAIWEKAIVNAGINPLGALLGIPNGEIVTNEFSLKLQQEIVREAVEVANAMGVKLDTDEMTELTRSVCEKTCKNLCSMLQDVTAKRKTEIDNINGIIVKYSQDHSIKTPYNEAIYCLIKAKELNY